MNTVGEPIRGELHSTDAHSGVEIPIYNQGSLSARVLAADELIEVHTIKLISVAGGDCYVNIGADSTAGAGEYVLRGTFAANGGEVESRTLFTGRPGHKPYVTAPAGVVDVIFTGVIRKGTTPGVRPAWRESLVPGH